MGLKARRDCIGLVRYQWSDNGPRSLLISLKINWRDKKICKARGRGRKGLAIKSVFRFAGLAGLSQLTALISFLNKRMANSTKVVLVGAIFLVGLMYWFSFHYMTQPTSFAALKPKKPIAVEEAENTNTKVEAPLTPSLDPGRKYLLFLLFYLFYCILFYFHLLDLFFSLLGHSALRQRD